MTCLIVSDQIRVQLDNADVAVPAKEVISPSSYNHSSHQKPDIHRLRLASMLRRSPTAGAEDGARLTWSTMLNRRMAECANGNAS